MIHSNCNDGVYQVFIDGAPMNFPNIEAANKWLPPFAVQLKPVQIEITPSIHLLPAKIIQFGATTMLQSAAGLHALSFRVVDGAVLAGPSMPIPSERKTNGKKPK